jgi:phage shock protein E
VHPSRVLALFVILLAAPSCEGSSDPGTPALARRLVREQGALLLDVRSPDEFESGHIEGAKLLPHDQVAAHIEEIAGWLDGDRSKPIVVYCRSGNRSGKAKRTLEQAGFTQVIDLGAMSSWCEDC